MLASSLEFGSAAAPALTVLLKMGSWLPADQFSIKVIFSFYLLKICYGQRCFMNHQIVWLIENAGPFQVLPTIVKLFASNDRAIRACLLQHIDQFGESLSAQTVDEQVCDLFCNRQLDICICVSGTLSAQMYLMVSCSFFKRFFLMLPLASPILLFLFVNWHWSRCSCWHQKWVASNLVLGKAII